MTLLRHFRCLRGATLFAALLLALFTASAEAQFYAGALGGISTLSGDTAASVNSTSANFSTYNPQNGLALNALFGRHFNDFLTVQGDYVWNRNALHLTAATSGSGSIGDYDETRRSSQQSLFASILVYFRKRKSWIRPYLSVGTGWVHLSSTEEMVTLTQGLPLPPHDFSANMIALRVPVGMDVRLHDGWLFRYAFSETLSGNPISDHLSPPGPHSLKNFQNLFGILKQF
ncbi:MAG: outer membrane beta-barrel protein [Terriglobales bacterium]